MRRALAAISLSLLILPLSTLPGCGSDGPALAEVEGTVTFDGRAVPGAQVLFVPTGVKASNPSYGLTDPAGHYKMFFTRDKSGAMIASHDVTITKENYSKEEIENMRAAGQNISTDVIALPKKYRTAGELKAEVKKGPNTIDFKLTR